MCPVKSVTDVIGLYRQNIFKKLLTEKNIIDIVRKGAVYDFIK
jgi:hypothetical protein